MQKGVILGCGNRSNAGMDTVTLVPDSINMVHQSSSNV
jgi:hypothetical protein